MRPLFSPLPISSFYQIPVLYESSKNTWGDGDTSIDLDMHPAAGVNVGHFLRVRGFPFGGGSSGCEIKSPSEGLLLPPPLNLISPDSKESRTARAVKGFSQRHGSLVFTSGRFRRSSGRMAILLPVGISDVWRFFILTAAKILHICCSILVPVSGRRSLLFW